MKKPLLAQFDLHNRLFHNVLEDFTDEQTNQRLHKNTNINHVKYIAGHLLNSQYGLAMLVDIPIQPKWQDLFAPLGQSYARDDISYPTIEEIKSEWKGIHQRIRGGFEKLSDEALNRRPPEPLDKIFENDPIFENTVAGFWTFLNHHQAYHIGQIGLLRRGFGKDPMTYG